MKIFVKIISLCLCFMTVFSLVSETGAVVWASGEKNKTKDEVTHLESNITSMNLKGYVGKTIDNNIVRWQISAYEKNKTIIGQIAHANSKGGDSSQDTENLLWWYGEFVGKLLTGMAYSYKISPSTELKAAIDKIIVDLKKAQGDDGYLGVFTGGARYALETENWDMWGQYHCVTGLLEWYKLSGNKDALDIARKTLDCAYETFKDRSYLATGAFPTSRSIAHGYAQMYQVTREEKYLSEAERIIKQDCQDDNGWYKNALNGGHFYSSSCARWEVLHMIMTLGILYEETGNREYYTVMANVWNDILKYDIHNGGGFTTNEGAVGNPYMEGVIETCCTIAWAAFTNEFYKYEKTVAVADELERTYYNALLGSLIDTDRTCTYNTPMDGVIGESGIYDGRKVPSQQDIAFQYNVGSPDMNCCQANIARGLGQLVEWAAVTDGDELYLNYYGSSAITTKVAGKSLTLEQTTKYPVNGNVVITVSGLEKETEFTLKLRIPAWAYGSTVTVGGVKNKATEGQYYSVKRTWKNGDKIELFIAEGFTFWAGQSQQRGYTSVYYGPILLTLDKYFAENFDQKTKFDVLAFEKAEVVSGYADDAILTVAVESDKGSVKLVDFASAGKNHGKTHPSEYWSWLTVTDAPETSTDLARRWMTSDKKKVDFDAYAVTERTLFYAGETVEFTVEVPENKLVASVTLDGEALSISDGKYSFVMPENDVAVSVSFEDKPSRQSSLPWWIAGAVSAIAAAVLIPLALKKKNKNKK